MITSHYAKDFNDLPLLNFMYIECLPVVKINVVLNASSENLKSTHVLSTPESRN
jgi:hypothetical protein